MKGPITRGVATSCALLLAGCQEPAPALSCQGIAHRVASDDTTEVLAVDVLTQDDDPPYLVIAHAWKLPAIVERLPWRPDEGDTDVRAARVDLEQLQRGGIPLARDWVLGPCEQRQENTRCALEPEGTLLLEGSTCVPGQISDEEG